MGLLCCIHLKRYIVGAFYISQKNNQSFSCSYQVLFAVTEF